MLQNTTTAPPVIVDNEGRIRGPRDPGVYRGSVAGPANAPLPPAFSPSSKETISSPPTFLEFSGHISAADFYFDPTLQSPEGNLESQTVEHPAWEASSAR